MCIGVGGFFLNKNFETMNSGLLYSIIGPNSHNLFSQVRTVSDRVSFFSS